MRPWLLRGAAVLAFVFCASLASMARDNPIALLATIPITGIHTGGKFSFDIGYVDTTTNRYLVTDRTNAAVDVVDIATNTLVKQVKGGFTGARRTPDESGPNGIVGITGTTLAYAGDVGSVKIIDYQKGVVTKSIPIAHAKLRTDEGCYDPDDSLVMYSNPEDSPPFATWISTKTQRVVATLQFTGAEGLEQCVYDAHSKAFLVNNGGTAANPLGEVDVIPAASVGAEKPTIAARFRAPGCPVAGMALGPNDELLIGCAAKKQLALRTLILNASTGAVLKTITQVGGEDQVAYDAVKQRFYTASRDMTSSGVAGSGRPTPVLGVIDAVTMTWLENVPTGTNAHSVAADGKTNHVFVPVPPTTSTSGGINVYRYR
jgi:hypothetical protein